MAGDNLSWPGALKHTAIRDRWFARFARLKPGMTLQQIADRLDEPYASVHRWASIFRYEFPDLRCKGLVSEHGWEQVDWTLRDAEIARTLGLSRERVRQVRVALRKGLCAYRSNVARFTRWIAANRDKINGTPVRDIAVKYGDGLSVQVVRRLLRDMSIEPHDASVRWRSLDWRLPNRDLARIWSTTPKYIANIRAKLKVGPAVWDGKRPEIELSLEYQTSLAQEMIKSRGGRGLLGATVPRIPDLDVQAKFIAAAQAENAWIETVAS